MINVPFTSLHEFFIMFYRWLKTETWDVHLRLTIKICHMLQSMFNIVTCQFYYWYPCYSECSDTQQLRKHTMPLCIITPYYVQNKTIVVLRMNCANSHELRQKSLVIMPIDSNSVPWHLLYMPLLHSLFKGQVFQRIKEVHRQASNFRTI